MKNSKVLFLKIDPFLESKSIESNLNFIKLLDFLKSYFKDVIITYQKDQLDHFLNYKKTVDIPIISLDPLVRAELNIEISRMYSVPNNSYSFVGYAVRPESPYVRQGIDFQFYQVIKTLENLQSKEVCLYDDDIVYGGQFRFVTAELKKSGIDVVNTAVFLDNSELNYEILDLRDLILNCPYGGIIINSNPFTRMPYFAFKQFVKTHCNITEDKDITTFMNLCRNIELN